MQSSPPDRAEKADFELLVDFVMFTQPRCVLNLSAKLIQGNVSFVQFFLLAYLSNVGFLTMSNIAKKMGHSTAAATGLVDRLESLSYVERVHAEDDRRKILVRITRGGGELVADMRKELASDLAGIFSGLAGGCAN